MEVVVTPFLTYIYIYMCKFYVWRWWPSHALYIYIYMYTLDFRRWPHLYNIYICFCYVYIYIIYGMKEVATPFSIYIYILDIQIHTDLSS